MMFLSLTNYQRLSEREILYRAFAARFLPCTLGDCVNYQRFQSCFERLTWFFADNRRLRIDQIGNRIAHTNERATQPTRGRDLEHVVLNDIRQAQRIQQNVQRKLHVDVFDIVRDRMV